MHYKPTATCVAMATVIGKLGLKKCPTNTHTQVDVSKKQTL